MLLVARWASLGMLEQVQAVLPSPSLSCYTTQRKGTKLGGTSGAASTWGCPPLPHRGRPRPVREEHATTLQAKNGQPTQLCFLQELSMAHTQEINAVNRAWQHMAFFPNCRSSKASSIHWP